MQYKIELQMYLESDIVCDSTQKIHGFSVFKLTDDLHNSRIVVSVFFPLSRWRVSTEQLISMGVVDALFTFQNAQETPYIRMMSS